MLKELKEAYEEELRDVEKYHSLADEVPDEYKSILYDIASEEKWHARHLDLIIKDLARHCGGENMEVEPTANATDEAETAGPVTAETVVAV